MAGRKILQICAVDTTVVFLLQPLLDRLEQEGYEVHVACAPGQHRTTLQAQSYTYWPTPIARKFASVSHFRSFWRLYRLIKKERFDLVHVHTPVAAALGRIAAKLAGVPQVVYTAHGFYFHEHMTPWLRRLLMWLETWLGRCCTNVLMCQSQEDAETAIQQHMLPNENIHWISNGVDIGKFLNAGADVGGDLRAALGLLPEHKVVGFTGRLVREKGVIELLEAMALVRQRVPKARLLVVGDTLHSDRDNQMQQTVSRLVNERKLHDVVVFAGFRNDVPELLCTMDVFALPSYREGMPRSIIEAMASGLPVVATNIRGCREEVVDGQTGCLVPLGQAQPLADALIDLLTNPSKAQKMGQAGQEHAKRLFDERLVLERELQVFNALTGGH